MIKFCRTFLLIICLYHSASTSATNSPIAVSGTVLNSQGQPIAGVVVKADEQHFTTDMLGYYFIPELKRQNILLSISHAEFKSEIISLHLLKPESLKHYQLDPIILSPQIVSQTRMVFGGDTSFGRRYIDPDEVTPRDQLPADNTDALILVSNPVPGSQAVAQYIRPLFQNSDWSVLNLETPVTRNPSTPHIQKAFAFFTLPESVQALTWLGVDYVSLGNNHLYDYLDIGVEDTITSLDNVGIPHSGAGLNSAQALLPYQQQLKNSSYSFLSMTSVSGSQHKINYVAAKNKAGAGDLRDHDAVGAAIQSEVDKQNIPILQLHGGREYTFEPTERFMEHIQFVVESGAKLVIGHHPHVAQGIGMIDDIVTIHSLGNLIFDQARLETMLGLVARVDLDADKVSDVRFYPIYIDNFIPKPLTGDLANIFLRRIGEFSRAYGALVYPYNHQGRVAFNGERDIRVDRSLNVNISIPASGETIVDLRQIADSRESLLSVTTDNAGLNVQIGRDVLNHGDFEDADVDAAALVATRWNTSKSSSSICSESPFRGAAALCSTRSSSNSFDSVVSFRNRIRVMGESTGEPNKDLSLFAYFKGDNAGPISIITRFYASAGSITFGEEQTFIHPGGTFNWQPLFANINMPADSTDNIKDVENNPRAVRFFLRQSPQSVGDGQISYDDFAVINWEEQVSLEVTNTLLTPHARDFLRIKGNPGVYRLTLIMSSYAPKSSHFVSPLLLANGKNDLIIDDKSNISVNLKLHQHLQNNPPVDWWVYATTETGQYFSYVYPQGWQKGNIRTIANPQIDIANFDLFNGSLPQGRYSVHFCIDKNLDNQKDCDWQDTLTIEVNKAITQ